MAADWYPEYDETSKTINLVAEEGDNEESLKEWSNGTFSDEEVSNLYASMEDRKIDMSNTFIGQFSEGFEADAGGCEFNCFSFVESGMLGNDQSTGYGTSNQEQFESFVESSGMDSNPFNQSSLDQAKPFKSALGYNKKGEPEVLDHVSINAGKDNGGTTWVLTKNGYGEKLKFQKGNDYYGQVPDKVYK